MIKVKENQSLKEAVEEFNKIHNAKLKERIVKNWENLPEIFGEIKISPYWNPDTFIESIIKKKENLILKNF